MIDSDDEKSFFEIEMEKVKPLSKKFGNKVSLKAPSKLKKGADVFQQTVIDDIDHSLHHVKAVLPEHILSYKTGGVTSIQFNKLRKGKILYRLSLDLHQEKRHCAVAKINTFIDKNSRLNLSCCLIIHGKGQGLIKSVTEKALMNNKKVIAFHSAVASHGGAGAVYVLLKSSI